MCRIIPTLLAIRRNLIKPKYRKKTTGHCYVAAEALYNLLSDKQKHLYKPNYLKVNGDHIGI
jgi:hypothetical protein